MKQPKLLIITVFIIHTTFFFSCKIKEGVLKYQRNTISNKNISKNVDKSYIKPKTLWIKNITIDINTDNTRRFKGNLRVIRDSVIILGIGSNFGLEGIRLVLTRDTLIVINRLNKTYFKDAVKNIKEIGRDLNIYADIQEIIMNNSKTFLLEFLNNNSKERKSELINGKYCLTAENILHKANENKRFKILECCFNASSFRAENIVYLVNKQQKVYFFYDKYLENDQFFCARVMRIKLALKKEWKITIKNQKVNFNVEIPAIFHISKKYLKVEKLRNL